MKFTSKILALLFCALMCCSSVVAQEFQDPINDPYLNDPALNDPLRDDPSQIDPLHQEVDPGLVDGPLDVVEEPTHVELLTDRNYSSSTISSYTCGGYSREALDLAIGSIVDMYNSDPAAITAIAVNPTSFIDSVLAASSAAAGVASKECPPDDPCHKECKDLCEALKAAIANTHSVASQIYTDQANWDSAKALKESCADKKLTSAEKKAGKKMTETYNATNPPLPNEPNHNTDDICENAAAAAAGYETAFAAGGFPPASKHCRAWDAAQKDLAKALEDYNKKNKECGEKDPPCPCECKDDKGNDVVTGDPPEASGDAADPFRPGECGRT